MRHRPAFWRILRPRCAIEYRDGRDGPRAHADANRSRLELFSSIYAPDAGRAVAAAVDLPSGIYNVCDDEPLLFSEYLRIVAESVGAPKPMHLPGFLGSWIFGDVWKYFSRSLRITNTGLKAASNWKPPIKSAREGWPLAAAALAK